MKQILKQFNIKDKILNIIPIKKGYINNTFYIECINQKYILQKLNTNIFKDLNALRYNYYKLGIDCKIYNNWKIYKFFDGRSIDISNEDQLKLGINAIVQFQRKYINFDKPLFKIIQNFHNQQYYLGRLKLKIKDNKDKIVDQLSNDIFQYQEYINKVIQIENSNRIQKRIIHGDANIDNILIRQDKYCLIDLDTIMYGYIQYDFAQYIRSVINYDNIDKYEMLLNLYLEKAKYLIKQQRQTLGLYVIVILLQNAIRFLTDYLDNNSYYKVTYQEQNLDRCKKQIKILKVFEKVINNNTKNLII